MSRTRGVQRARLAPGPEHWRRSRRLQAELPIHAQPGDEELVVVLAAAGKECGRIQVAGDRHCYGTTLAAAVEAHPQAFELDGEVVGEGVRLREASSVLPRAAWNGTGTA